MPFVFFAHQAPLLPIVRRWPGRVDGVALLIGSMAPDFAYVFTGTRLAISAHAFPGLLTFCVPATLLVAWIVVRILAPIVPAHLPELGGFHLGEVRGLVTHRFRPIATPTCAFLGACTHAGMDQFTHGYGWFARNFEWYRAVLWEGTWLGRPWTPFRLLQYAGHIGLTGLCLALLWRYGRERWLAARAATIPAPVPSLRTHLALWGPTLAGAALGMVLVLADPQDSSAALLRMAGGTFAGLTVGALWARRAAGRARGGAAGA